MLNSELQSIWLSPKFHRRRAQICFENGDAVSLRTDWSKGVNAATRCDGRWKKSEMPAE
jgi:hypothetical protein